LGKAYTYLRMAEAYVKVTDPPATPANDKESKVGREPSGDTKVNREPSGDTKVNREPSGDNGDGKAELSRQSSNLRPGIDRQKSKRKPKGDKSALDDQTKLFAEKGNIFSASYAADKETLLDWVKKEGTPVVQTVGPVGDCPFLILFLIHSPAHLEIADTLIKLDPKLIYSEYKQFRTVDDEQLECPLYYGETALHLAVVNKNEALVDCLLETQRQLHERGQMRDLDLLTMPALGSFFAPPIEKGPCYYGQVPLGFAACTANKSMCDKLLHKWNANLEFEDTYGNNVLHLLAMHNLPDMFTYFLEEEAKSEAKSKPDYVPLSRRKNLEGDTPLAVAARTGNKEVFGMIVESSKVTVWKYGPIEMIKFPLVELDTLNLKEVEKRRKGEPTSDDDKYEGIINTLIREGNLELLMQNVLVDILDNKWTRYAFRRYIWRCIKQTVLILSVTLALILGFPDPCNYSFDDPSSGAASVFRLIFEAIVVFMVVTKGISEANEMREAGLKDYYGDVGVAFLENALSSSYCFFFFIVFILRIVGVSRRGYFLAHEGDNSTSIYGADYFNTGTPGDDPSLNEFNAMVAHVDVLAQFIAVFLIYIYGVTLLLGFRLTGPFVIMISKMMASDVTRWCLVFIVMWLGFATTFLALQSVPQPTSLTGWDQMWINLVGLYQIMLGQGSLDDFVLTIAQDWRLFFDIGGKILIVIYAVLMAVMMLNLLIAMMMDTFAEVKETTQIQYMQFKAQIISSLENEMSDKEWQHVLPYWIMDNGEPWLQIQIKNESFLQQAVNLAAVNAALAPAPAPVVPKKTSTELFTEADVNNDGKISKSELASHEKRIRAQIEQELLQRWGHLMPRAGNRPQNATTTPGYVSVNDIQGEGFAHSGTVRVD